MKMADTRHLFDYNEWANGLTVDAASQLSDEQLRHDTHISHGSILGTLLHIAGDEWIWLERWHGRSPQGPDAWSAWRVENCPDLATLRQRWREVVEERNAFL